MKIYKSFSKFGIPAFTRLTIPAANGLALEYDLSIHLDQSSLIIIIAKFYFIFKTTEIQVLLGFNLTQIPLSEVNVTFLISWGLYPGTGINSKFLITLAMTATQA